MNVTFDPLSSLFLIAFLVGLVFTGLSLLLGFDHGSHLHAGHADLAHGPGLDAGHALGHGDAHPAGDGGAHHAGGPSPFNLMSALAFLTWFGGAGFVLYYLLAWAALLSLAAALLAGFAGGAVIFLVLSRVLWPNQTVMRPEEYRLEGTIARVSVPIREGRVGEVVFSKGGTRRSEGARSLDGSPIARGTEVVILRYERGLAVVQPWATYLTSGGAALRDAGGE